MDFFLNNNKYALHENRNGENDKQKKTKTNNFCLKICDLDFRSICLNDFGQGKHQSTYIYHRLLVAIYYIIWHQLLSEGNFFRLKSF